VAIAGAWYTRRAGVSGRRERTTNRCNRSVGSPEPFFHPWTERERPCGPTQRTEK
jgi:hypothetical protein